MNPKWKCLRLSKSRFAKFLAEAPVIIIGCGDRKASPKWYKVDVSIAMQNMALAATALGLGTCWVGSFDEKKVKELLKIPEKFEVIALLAVGYPREKLDLSAKLLHLFRRRKSLNKLQVWRSMENPSMESKVFRQ